MTNPAQDNDQTQSGLTDLINALKGQALNMGALTQAFQALSTALTNALARIYTVFVGDSGSGGVKGLVPAPAAGDAAANKFLKASGGWAVINNPSASALGGVKSLAAVAHNFLTQIGTDGSVLQAQPVSADITGTTTNNDAAAGYIGEIITSNIAVGSAVGLSNGVTANVTSINLTAGDWDVVGWVATNTAGTTTISQYNAGVSTTTADLGNFPSRLRGIATPAGTNVAMPVSTERFSLSGTTTVFLTINVAFATSTCGGFGYITGRRAR